MSIDIERRLDVYLQEQATSLQPDGAGAEAAMAVGTRIQRRRYLLTSVAAVLFLVLGVGAAFMVRSALAGDPADKSSPEAATTLAPGGVAGAPGGAAVAAPLAPLEWYAVDATLGYSTRLLPAEGGGFYALSTAPGQGWVDFRPPASALYRSDDGETWSAVFVAEEFGMTDFAIRGDTIYAVGTAPGFSVIEGTDPAYNLSTSSDGGETWSTTPLETAAKAPLELGNVNWVEAQAHIAAGPAAIVASTFTRFHADLSSLVPAEFRREAVDVRPTQDGIEVMDYMIWEQLDMQCWEQFDQFDREFDIDDIPEEELTEPCRQLLTGETPDEAVVYSATWEELGFPGGSPLLFAELHVSTDGKSFETVESPFADDEWIRGIYPAGDGFLGLSWGRNTSVVRYSPDGRSWTDLAIPAMQDITQVGTYGGRTIVVGAARDGTPLIVAADGSGNWEPADFGTMADQAAGGGWVSAAGIGAQGVVVAMHLWDEATEMSSVRILRGDGAKGWEEIPVGDLMGTSEDAYVEWLAVGTESIIGRVMVGGRFGPPTSMQIVGSVSS